MKLNTNFLRNRGVASRSRNLTLVCPTLPLRLAFSGMDTQRTLRLSSQSLFEHRRLNRPRLGGLNGRAVSANPGAQALQAAPGPKHTAKRSAPWAVRVARNCVPRTVRAGASTREQKPGARGRFMPAHRMGQSNSPGFAARCSRAAVIVSPPSVRWSVWVRPTSVSARIWPSFCFISDRHRSDGPVRHDGQPGLWATPGVRWPRQACLFPDTGEGLVTMKHGTTTLILHTAEYSNMHERVRRQCDTTSIDPRTALKTQKCVTWCEQVL